MKRVNYYGLNILTAVALLLPTVGCGSKKVVLEANRYTALGEVMAQQTTELCGGQGNIVLLVDAADSVMDTGFGQAQAAFRKTLNPAIRITATETLKLPMGMPGTEVFLPANFLEEMQKYSAATTVVSFVGMPGLTAEQISQLPSPRPKVVLVVTHGAPRKNMFAQNVISLAALPKPLLDVNESKAGSAQERFDTYYQLVTQQKFGSLPN